MIPSRMLPFLALLGVIAQQAKGSAHADISGGCGRYVSHKEETAEKETFVHFQPLRTQGLVAG